MRTTRWKLPSLSRQWLAVPPLLLAVIVAAVLIARRQTAGPEAVQEVVRPMRVIHVKTLDVIPRALGFGTAKPGEVWQAVAEVRGRVVEVHPQLKAGAMIKQNEVLLRIDPNEYELMVAQTDAEIARVEAQLAELTVAEANDRASLEIEKAALAIAQTESQRIESAAQQNAASLTERDKQRRALLTQQQVVQRLQNALDLLPHQRRSLEAELAVKQADLRRQQLDIARTEIRAPFDCRLGDVELRLEQFLAAGQVLFEAHGTSMAEVEAQVPLDQLRTLISQDHGIQTPVMMNPETVNRLFDFDVVVRYRSGDFQVEWEGYVVRLREQLDPRTRTIGLVVAVDKPYEQAIPGQRPPLIQGMFCEVELRGRPRIQRIVIPRAAWHDGHVFVVDSEQRLRRRAAAIAFAQSDFLCIESGLDPSDILVVSDPSPAIEGARIRPLVDPEVSQRLAAQASGEAPLR